MIPAVVLALALAIGHDAAPGQRAEQGPGQEAVQPANPLARRAVDLAHATPGTHDGWRERRFPPLYDLAMDAFRRGDNPAALEFLLVLLDRDPDLPPATLMLASVYFKLRRHDDVVSAYGRFLAHAPEEIQRTRHLGHSLYSLGRYDEACAHYKRVLQRGPDARGLSGVARARTLRGLGVSQRHLGDLKSAQASLKASLRFAPKDPEAHLALAQVLDELDALEPAVVAVRQARTLAPFDPRAAFLLASLLDALGQPEDAAKERVEFERLAPIDTLTRDLETRLLHAPHDRQALKSLAQLHSAIGNANGLQRALRRLGSKTLEDVIFTLDTSTGLDPAGAHTAAQQLQNDYAGEERAWCALAAYFERMGNARRCLEARARARELARDGENGRM